MRCKLSPSSISPAGNAWLEFNEFHKYRNYNHAIPVQKRSIMGKRLIRKKIIANEPVSRFRLRAIEKFTLLEFYYKSGIEKKTQQRI